MSTAGLKHCRKQCRIYRIYGNHNMEMKGMLGEAMILDNCEGRQGYLHDPRASGRFLTQSAGNYPVFWCGISGNR